jgi:beta-mannosidase
MTNIFSGEIMSQSIFMSIELKQNWKFRQAEQEIWHPANVPGTIHTDLFANKIIEDPFYRTNERDQQWIDKVDWEYKTTFQLDEKFLSKENL